MTQNVKIEGGNIKGTVPTERTKRPLYTALGVIVLTASAYVIYNSDKIVSTPLPSAAEPFHSVMMWQEIVISLASMVTFTASIIFIMFLWTKIWSISLMGGIAIAVLLTLNLSIIQSATNEPNLVKWAQDRYGIVLEDSSENISKDIMTYTTLTGETGTATARKVEGGYLLYKLDGSKELPVKVDESK